MASLALALGDDQRPVTPGAVGDERLAAVDDELVAESPSHRCDAGHVRARVGLCDGDRRDLLAPDRRSQPAPLLVLGPELEYRWRGHLGLHRDCHAKAAATDPRQLLRQHHGREVVAALAAVFRRIAQPQEAQLAEPLEDRVREGLLLPLLEVRLDLFLEELADVEAEFLMGVGEVHRQGV